MQWICLCWVTARMEMGTSFVLLAVALLSVCLRGSVSPIALGLALSYSLQVFTALHCTALHCTASSLHPVCIQSASSLQIHYIHDTFAHSLNY